MERADPLFLLIGLPTIPVMLILGKMIRWEDYVLRLWRKYSNKLQILNSIFPGQDTRLCSAQNLSTQKYIHLSLCYFYCRKSRTWTLFKHCSHYEMMWIRAGA